MVGGAGARQGAEEGAQHDDQHEQRLAAARQALAAALARGAPAHRPAARAREPAAQLRVLQELRARARADARVRRRRVLPLAAALPGVSVGAARTGRLAGPLVHAGARAAYPPPAKRLCIIATCLVYIVCVCRVATWCV